MFKNLFSGARPKKPGASASNRASRESLETGLEEEPAVKATARDKSPKAKPRKEKAQKDKAPKEKKRSGGGVSPFGSGLLHRRGSKEKEKRRLEAEQERRLQEDLQERDRILRDSQEGGLWEVPLGTTTSQTVQLNGHTGEDVTEGRPPTTYSSHSSSPATSPTEKEPPKKAKDRKKGKDKKDSKVKDGAGKSASSVQLEVPLPPPPPSVTLALAASRKSSSSSSSSSDPPQSPMGPQQPSVSEMVDKFEKTTGGESVHATPTAREVPLEQKVSLVELKVQESLVVQQMRERQQRERMDEFERSTRVESLYATVEPRHKEKPQPVVELPAKAREELENQAEDIVRQVRDALEAEQNAFEERLQKRLDEEKYRDQRWKLAMETVDEEWRAAAERLRVEEQRLRGRREADLQEAVAEARQLLRLELDEERLQVLAGARLALRQHAEAALRDQAEDVLAAADRMVADAVAAALSKHKAKLERQQEELDSKLSSVTALDSRLQQMEAKMADREKQMAAQAEALAELEVQLEHRSRQLEEALVRKEQQEELESKVEHAMARLGRILEEEERATERRSEQEQMWRVSLERLEAESRSRLERLETSERQQQEQWHKSLESREEAAKQLREAVEQQERRLAAAREQLAQQLAALQGGAGTQEVNEVERKVTSLIQAHEARLEEDSAARKKLLEEAEDRLQRSSTEVERKLAEAKEQMSADLERKLEAVQKGGERTLANAQEQLTLRIHDYEALLARRREEEVKRREKLDEEASEEVRRWRQDQEGAIRRLEESLEESRGRLETLAATVAAEGALKSRKRSRSSSSSSSSDGEAEHHGGKSVKKLKAEVWGQVLAELDSAKKDLQEVQRKAAEEHIEASRLVLEEMEAALVARIESRLGEIQQVAEAGAKGGDGDASQKEIHQHLKDLAEELRVEAAKDISSQWKLERVNIKEELVEDLEVKLRRYIQDMEGGVRTEALEEVHSKIEEVKTAVIATVIAEMTEEKWSNTAKNLQKDIVGDVMERVKNERKGDINEIKKTVTDQVLKQLQKTVDDIGNSLDHKLTERLSTSRNDEREYTKNLVVSLIEERGKLISGEMDEKLLEGVVVHVKGAIRVEQDRERQELMEEWNETIKRSTVELRDKMEKEVSEEVKKRWKEDSNKIRKDLEEELKDEIKGELKKVKKDVREDVTERMLSEVRENEIKIKAIIAAEVGTISVNLQHKLRDELVAELSEMTKSVLGEEVLKSKQQVIQDLEAVVREAVGVECGRVLATLSRHEQEARDRLGLVCQELIRGQLERLGRCCDQAIEKATQQINSDIRESAGNAVHKAQERLSALELEATSRVQSEYDRLLHDFQEECDQRLQQDLQMEEDRKREMEERKQRLKDLIENIFAEEESVSTENMAEALLEEEEAELERRLSLRGSQRGRRRPPPEPQPVSTLDGTERVESWALVQGNVDVAASKDAPATQQVAAQRPLQPPPLPPKLTTDKGDGEKTVAKEAKKKEKKEKKERGGKERSSTSSSSSSSSSEGEESARALQRAGVGRGTWQLVGGAGHAALSLRAAGRAESPGAGEGQREAPPLPPPPLPTTAPPAPPGLTRPISYIPGRSGGDDKDDDGAVFV